ncbi:mRNA binding protein puf3 [Ophidiomyces ophidiicola]|nr:mRNA binding protein puf3 [Ophidiomyces ophidiicola]KAI1997989.1 mRNA binding protein puf3 [Ophidiomyces ophidiicola]
MAPGLSNGNSAQIRAPRFQQADTLGAGRGFSSTNGNWSGAWSNPTMTNTSSDNALENADIPDEIEGRSGSGCLLATSESDGWDGRLNLPWNVNSQTAPSITPPGIGNAPSGHSSPYFTSARPAAIGMTARTAAQRTFFTHSDSISGASFGTSASNGMINHNTPPQPSNIALNMGPATDYTSNHAFPATNGDITIYERSNVHFGFRGFASQIASQSGSVAPTPYSHASHNSIGTFPYRSAHSSQSSFHSDSDNNEIRNMRTQSDIALAFSGLELESNAYMARSQSNSHRPGYVSHSSFDGSLPQFRNPLGLDDLPLSNYRTYSPESFALHSRRSDRDDDPPSLHNVGRNGNPGFYSTHGSSPVAGRLMFSIENQLNTRPLNGPTEVLDRRLQSLQNQQQYRAASAQTRGMPRQNQGYSNASYQTGPMSQTVDAYGMPSLTGVSPATIPRHSYRSKEPEVFIPLRSPLLEEFRANIKGNKRYDLKDIYDHIVEFSGDQHGSRFIQTKLETAHSDEKDRVFQEIRPNAIQLMKDVFGNYVIQNLFEHGSQAQKKALAQQMMGDVLNLSTQMYGCRVVQKALEHVLLDQQAEIVKELEQHVFRCVKDQNGNHVIQKAIERVPQDRIQFIIDCFKGQIPQWAVHSYGCRVIQRMLEHCNAADCEAILAELHRCCASLIPDQFGNYVIQHVIENGEKKDKLQMISVVISQVVSFSKHKFASNVVEKTIEFGCPSDRSRIFKVFITPNDHGESPLLGLMRDQYGNYVVQKVLQVLQGREYHALVEQIHPLLSQLKKFSYGKQIAAIEKYLVRHAPSVSPNSSRCPSPFIANDMDSACEDNAFSTRCIPSSRGSIAQSTNTSIDSTENDDQKPA